MNWFNRNPILAHWQPTVHCIADPGAEPIWKDPEYVRRLFAGLKPRAFVVTTDVYCQIHSILPDASNVFGVKYNGPATNESCVDLTKPIPSAPDTSVLAVIVAIAMGCSPIYILGVDYDLLTHRGTRRHFYSEEPGEVEQYAERPYLRMIEQARESFSAHYAIARIARRYNCQIYNATPESFLDAYPAATFETITNSPAV